MHTYTHLNSNCVCVCVCVRACVRACVYARERLCFLRVFALDIVLRLLCHKVLRGDSVELHQSFLLDVDSREHEVCTIQSHSQDAL